MKHKIKRIGKNWSLSTRISVFITSATIIGLLLIWAMTSKLMINVISNNITNQMTDAVESRAAVINNYVSEAEEHLMAFSLNSLVRELLLDQTNKELQAQAQQYTLDFAATKGIFEGLYIADIYTRPITHLTVGAIGKGTREGARLTDFQNTILRKHGITNIGIMQSPSTGNMVLSMYYPLYDERDVCIGYVGAAVYADRLMDSLLELEIEGLPNSKYIFLNAETGVYLYHENKSMLNTETTDPSCIEIIKQIKNGSRLGSYSDNDGNFTVYKYLPDRGWVFMVQDSKEEIFQEVGEIESLIGFVCILVAALIILVSIARLRKIGGDLMIVRNAIEKLGKLELSTDSRLAKFSTRGNEIGLIAATTESLSKTLRDTVGDTDRILNAISNGDLTVDVSKNKSLYIGDFEAL